VTLPNVAQRFPATATGPFYSDGSGGDKQLVAFNALDQTCSGPTSALLVTAQIVGEPNEVWE
jgi:hypothetical protein